MKKSAHAHSVLMHNVAISTKSGEKVIFAYIKIQTRKFT